MFSTYCKTVFIIILAAVLFGCSGEADEAKKLGFASVDEMKEAHAKGWHTKERYEEDAARQKGFGSVAEMKAAIAKKKEEEEKAILQRKLAVEKRAQFAKECDFDMPTAISAYLYRKGLVSGGMEIIGFYIQARRYSGMEVEKDKQEQEKKQVVAAGVADFNGREIPACVEQLTLHFVNRSEGKRDTYCYMMGYLHDKEFGMYRAMESKECGEFNKTEWANKSGVKVIN